MSNPATSIVLSASPGMVGAGTELVARSLLVSIFLLSGIDKMENYAPTQALMAANSVSPTLLPAVIALDIVCSVAIVLGYRTRLCAIALALFTMAAAVLFHGDFSDRLNIIMFLKNTSMAGGLVLLACHGAGRYSLDARRGQARELPAASH